MAKGSKKFYTKKEMKGILESLNLDTRKYTVDYLAEKAGFKKASLKKQQPKAAAPKVITESSLRDLFTEFGLDTKKFKVSYLAEQFGVSQLLVESTGERVYLFEAPKFDLKKMAKTLGISASILGSYLAGQGLLSAPQQVQAVTGAPTSEVVRQQTEVDPADVAPTEGGDFSFVDENGVKHELPSAASFSKYLANREKVLKAAGAISAKADELGLKKLGTAGWRNNMMNNTLTTYPGGGQGRAAGYSYIGNFNIDPNSELFKSKDITPEEMEKILADLSTNAGFPIREPQNTWTVGSNINKDPDGTEGYDVAPMPVGQMGTYHNITAAVPAIDPVVGTKKSETAPGWNNYSGEDWDETDKVFDRKPLGKWNAAGNFIPTPNEEMDDDDFDVYFVDPSDENAVGKVDQFKSFVKDTIYPKTSTLRQYMDSGRRSTSQGDGLGGFTSELGHVERQEADEVQVDNSIDKAQTQSFKGTAVKYANARAAQGDKNINMDDLLRDYAARNQTIKGRRSAAETKQTSAAAPSETEEKDNKVDMKVNYGGKPEETNESAKLHRDDKEVEAERTKILDQIAAEYSKPGKPSKDSYTTGELKEAFARAGLDTRKFRVEYLAEQLGFRRINEAPQLVTHMATGTRRLIDDSEVLVNHPETGVPVKATPSNPGASVFLPEYGKFTLDYVTPAEATELASSDLDIKDKRSEAMKRVGHFQHHNMIRRK